MANSTADKQVTTGTRTDYTFFIKDRNAATNLGGGEPICGTVTLTTYAPLAPTATLGHTSSARQHACCVDGAESDSSDG
jgi:hypothetical protein